MIGFDVAGPIRTIKGHPFELRSLDAATRAAGARFRPERVDQSMRRHYGPLSARSTPDAYVRVYGWSFEQEVSRSEPVAIHIFVRISLEPVPAARHGAHGRPRPTDAYPQRLGRPPRPTIGRATGSPARARAASAVT